MVTYADLCTVVSLRECFKLHAFLDFKRDIEKRQEEEQEQKMKNKNGS